jgi:hypothetical protein
MAAGVGRVPMPPHRRRRWGAHDISSVTPAHEPRLDHVRRQDWLPRLNTDRPLCVLGRLFCLRRCRFASTPLRTVCDGFASRTSALGPLEHLSEPWQGQHSRHADTCRSVDSRSSSPSVRHPRCPRCSTPHPRLFIRGSAPPCVLAQALHCPRGACRVHGGAALRHAMAGRSIGL